MFLFILLNEYTENLNYNEIRDLYPLKRLFDIQNEPNLEFNVVATFTPVNLDY